MPLHYDTSYFYWMSWGGCWRHCLRILFLQCLQDRDRKTVEEAHKLTKTMDATIWANKKIHNLFTGSVLRVSKQNPTQY